MTVENPSWTLSRYVRASIICKGLEVNSRTATRAQIEVVAANIGAAGSGYDVRTVRAILLDKTVTSPYPAEAPASYAGK